MSGRLVLVGTPIGNLDDMSPRAITTLANADLIACEDTRHTGQLLQRLGINRDRPVGDGRVGDGRVGDGRAVADDNAVGVAGGGAGPVREGTVGEGRVKEGSAGTDTGPAGGSPDGSGGGSGRLELIAVHDHNEERQIDRILARLRLGHTVALVSDAGMPGISDPGEQLVAAAIDDGHTVEVVPGPTAGVAALVMSGMATGRFCFEGFLPRKGSARNRRLAELDGERRTIVLFEAPHRVARTIDDLIQVLGPERRVSLSREITKRFEETWRGTLANAGDWTAAADPRGEFVIVVDGADAPEPAADDRISARLEELLAGGSSVKDASATVARELNVRKKRVYNLALKISNDQASDDDDQAEDEACP